MYKLFSTLIVLCCSLSLSKAQKISLPYNNSNANQTPSYEEILNFYKQVDKKYKEAKLLEYAYVDVAEPLRVLEIKSNNSSSKEKISILINNGIHPGEPEGIDASMLLALNILELQNNESLSTSTYIKNNFYLGVLKDLLQYANIYIIPVYNIDGALNRNSYSRANQNGPESYGFRGNAKNLDLNRDFIKLDSRNAQEFTRLFQDIKPHLFVDNHTSNGADYQHVITYIATQKDKLNPNISKYMYNQFMPQLESQLAKYKYACVPYVNNWSNTPENGWPAFYESPRYATGYTTLFNTIGFTLETHMLKSYAERVEASYAYLVSLLEIAKLDHSKIYSSKKLADESVKNQDVFYLNWKSDTSTYRYIDFYGYEAEYKDSEIGDYKRLYYNREKPFVKKVKFYDTYRCIDSVIKPTAYIIPFAWENVINRLQLNGVQFKRVEKDSLMNLTVYYIKNYNTSTRAYEGHYLHSNTSYEKKTKSILVRKGDVIVYMNQNANRYIVETLEPNAIDSYFNWNFFDAVLQQKEYFSDYVFEDTALELLKSNPVIRKQFEEKKKSDKEFASNKNAQLDFIYKLSPYYEQTHLLYPVYRLEK